MRRNPTNTKHRNPRTSALAVAIAAALAALVVLGAGCELKMDAGGGGGSGVVPSQGCTGDADCPAGDYCEAEIGACVSPEPNELRVAVQLTPPPAADYATTQFLGITLAESGPVDLSMPAPRRVLGWVQTARNPLEKNVAATVTARAVGDIPGTEYSFSTESRKRRDADVESGYELLLAPTDQYYQVTVKLENEEFPPYHLAPRKFGQEEEWLDLVVPSLEDYHRITGRLVTDEATDTGLAGVRVGAFSEHSANTSTVSEIDVDGSFALSVPPEAEGDTYRVVVEPTDRTMGVPSMTLVEGLFVDADVDLGSLALGDLPALVLQEVLVTGPDGSPLAEVTVRCRGTVLDGTLTDEAVTDEDGLAVLYLRKGVYDCSCIPATGSTAAAVRWDDRSVDGLGRWQLEMGEKVRLEGIVTDHGGTRTLAGIPMIAIHIDEDDPLHGREVETTTDATGRYVLHLEPATYAFVLLPPEGTGLPVRVLDGLDLASDRRLDIALPPATLVTGTVRGSAGEPLAGVRVDFFQMPEVEPDPGAGADPPERVLVDRAPSASYDRLVRIVGSAVTDEEGIYRALLPNP